MTNGVNKNIFFQLSEHNHVLCLQDLKSNDFSENTAVFLWNTCHKLVFKFLRTKSLRRIYLDYFLNNQTKFSIFWKRQSCIYKHCYYCTLRDSIIFNEYHSNHIYYIWKISHSWHVLKSTDCSVKLHSLDFDIDKRIFAMWLNNV